MNLKKIIIPLCLIVAICLTTVTSAFAEQNENGTVFTKTAPESVIQYAEDESVQLLGEYLSSNRAIGKEHFTLGNPINIQEYASDNRIYHFPVMKNGEIFAILSVYDDNGNFSSQIEENMMAEQLHKMQISDELHDVLFISTDDGFYAVNGTKVIPLTPDSNAEMTEREAFIHGKNKLKKSNICNAIFTIDLNKKTSRQNILTETTTSKVLSVKSVPQTDDGTFYRRTKKLVRSSSNGCYY